MHLYNKQIMLHFVCSYDSEIYCQCNHCGHLTFNIAASRLTWLSIETDDDCTECCLRRQCLWLWWRLSFLVINPTPRPQSALTSVKHIALQNWSCCGLSQQTFSHSPPVVWLLFAVQAEVGLYDDKQ